ncbi:hypothetical protein K501DRAFT_130343, partial [Backusella circina FSU 941]
ELMQITKHAGVSLSAYCGGISQWSCESCRESVPDGRIVTMFKTLLYDINGFILHSDRDETIYLVFRGTMSVRNIIPDITLLYKDYEKVDGAFVQQGSFYDSYIDASEKFLPIFLRHVKSYPTYKIVVTGHSLGAAIATIAAPKLFEIDNVHFGPNNMKLYTYGSPRVGNEAFARYLVGTGLYISRSVHKNDLFTTIPNVSAGFLHVGIETHIYEDPDLIRVCTSKLESSLCSSSLTLTSIEDHL